MNIFHKKKISIEIYYFNLENLENFLSKLLQKLK